ncbi:MAG: phospholipid carrier-dependent glycosyltransferase [Actinobacteria bacterium]|nr:phospholipid carrier-dependent glycosyltransferase [Actinomycetota bacterium]
MIACFNRGLASPGLPRGVAANVKVIGLSSQELLHFTYRCAYPYAVTYLGIYLIAGLGFLLRVINLATPKGLVFDEVYYVDAARDFLAFGVEVTKDEPEFVVHPPLGKWFIAIGIRLFGDNEFGWRFATAVAGTISIILIGLIAQRLFRSQLLTLLATFLAAVDGLALVHSRTSLLDNFLTTLILAATYFFIRKNYVVTAIFLGLALGTKWSALYFIAVFGAVALYRAFTHHTGRNLIRPSIERILTFTLIPIAIYLATWVGWFLSDRGWGRDAGSNAITSFIKYHEQMLSFHTGLNEKHTYMAHPWTWLIQSRPTSFFYESPKTCGAPSCSQEVLAMGTPFLWWTGAIAIFVVFGFWIKSIIKRRMEPASTIIVMGMVAGYLPWFAFGERTVFSFYSIIFQPFLILAIVYCARWFISHNHKWGTIASSVFAVIVFFNFLYFLPIFVGDVMTYDAWYSRMWLPSWI